MADISLGYRKHCQYLILTHIHNQFEKIGKCGLKASSCLSPSPSSPKHHTGAKCGLEPLLLESWFLSIFLVVWMLETVSNWSQWNEAEWFCFIFHVPLKYHSVISFFQRRTTYYNIASLVPSTLPCIQKVPDNMRSQPLKLTRESGACQSSFPSRWTQHSCPWACGLGPAGFYCAAVKFSTVLSAAPNG